MPVHTLKHYEKEIGQIQHALRIGASFDEYKAVVKALDQPVRFECPLGEVIDTLAGFAMVWRWKGLLKPELIVQSDKFDAQGLEGKVSIPCTLYNALFYAMQARPNRAQIRA